MKDLLDCSKKQKIRRNKLLSEFGICYMEEIEGPKVKDIIIKDPRKIKVVVNFTDREFGIGTHDTAAIKGYIITSRLIRIGKCILIKKSDLNWFQKLLLKIAGLI